MLPIKINCLFTSKKKIEFPYMYIVPLGIDN